MGFSGAGQPLAALLWACSRVGALERLLCQPGCRELEDPGGGRSHRRSRVTGHPQAMLAWGPPQLACRSLCLLTCERGTLSFTLKDGGEV